MQKELSHINTKAFSLVEAVLSVALFALFITALAGVFLYGQESTMLAGNRARAVFLAEEGLEAALSIGDSGFINLTTGTHGITISGGKWIFSGSSDLIDIFTRTVDVSSIDANRKLVESTVTWQQNAQRNGTVVLRTRMTNWSAAAGAPSSCGAYAISQGYSNGICRANANQCTNNGQTHLPAGDIYCTVGPAADTCCALP